MRKSILVAIVVTAGCLLAQDLKPIPLPKPQTEGGRPLMQVLKDRKSTRDFAPDKLSQQLLSNLLWAAFGVNRPDGRRTAPSAMNWQEISIYVALSDGLFVYEAKDNRLQPVLAQDIRSATGTQPLAATAPLNCGPDIGLAIQAGSAIPCSMPILAPYVLTWPFLAY